MYLVFIYTKGLLLYNIVFYHFAIIIHTFEMQSKRFDYKQYLKLLNAFYVNGGYASPSSIHY